MNFLSEKISQSVDCLMQWLYKQCKNEESKAQNEDNNRDEIRNPEITDETARLPRAKQLYRINLRITQLNLPKN